MASKEMIFEAIDWAIFSVGGTIAAFLLPIHIIMTNLVGPLGLGGTDPIVYTGLASSLPPFLVKLYFFFVLGAAAWHGVHRVRFVLYEFGLSKHRAVVWAFSSSLLAAVLLLISLSLISV